MKSLILVKIILFTCITHNNCFATQSNPIPDFSNYKGKYKFWPMTSKQNRSIGAKIYIEVLAIT